ncbi:MAG: winged helix-turn-helix domain-containing protein [Burkholderiales bacterium]|nr:winged helix-turn-helix domain-containing protein [Burkholderiales bacterium]
MQDRVWFDRFELRPGERALLVDGMAVTLGARAFDVLVALAQRHDRVVTKQELLDCVWPDADVEENNLSVQISALRKLLGQDVIGTVPSQGYRLTVPVSQLEPAPGEAPAAPPRPSIAVLPFINLGDEREQEYFADGLAEDIIASLSNSRWLFVIDRGSSFVYRGSDLDSTAVARALGVRYLVSGSVRRSATKLRVNATLSNGATGEALWNGRYDRPLEDLFDMQDEISACIAGTIEPLFLRQEENIAAHKPARDLEHWDLLMRARWHYWRSTRKHAVECQRLLLLALARKPDDVQTLSLLAFSYLTDVWSGWAEDPKKRITEACRHALKAVSVNDVDSFAHLTLGVAMACIGDMDRAIAEQRRALEIYPHFAAAAAELGRLLAFSGQTAEAEALVRRAMAASPSEPRMSLWLFTLAIAAFVDARYGEAVRYARDALAQRPDWFFNHYLLAACQAANGDLPGAQKALSDGVKMMPRFTVAALKVGHPFVRDADRDRYVEALRKAGWKG